MVISNTVLVDPSYCVAQTFRVHEAVIHDLLSGCSEIFCKMKGQIVYSEVVIKMLRFPLIR